MSIQKYLEDMRKIQDYILAFLEREDKKEENFQILTLFLNEQKIYDDQQKLNSLLHLILKIANNYFNGPTFFAKIERILKLFKSSIKKYFSNYEIFNIFKSNKQILLFLIEEQVMIIDKYVAKNMLTNKKFINAKYPQFFAPEIFKYLKLNGADLSPSIFLYAIHGQNAEIIHLLEEDNIKPQDDASYLDYYLESIKCHHNDIANYFLNNFLQSNDENLLQFTLVYSLKCYNFAFIEDSLINEQLFFILCKYDYSILVDILMKNFDVKLNSKWVTDNTIHN